MVGEIALQIKAQKGKRKTKTVNQELVKEERKVCDLPREVLWTMNPRRFQTTIVPSVGKGLSQEVS